MTKQTEKKELSLTVLKSQWVEETSLFNIPKITDDSYPKAHPETPVFTCRVEETPLEIHLFFLKPRGIPENLDRGMEVYWSVPLPKPRMSDLSPWDAPNQLLKTFIPREITNTLDPIILTLNEYQFTKDEYATLQKLCFPRGKRGPIHPEANSYFGNLLKRILEEAGYSVVLEVLPEVPTFAIPSHPLMFTLLAMFSGKPERIPRKLLLKPYNERTPEEQKEADEFLKSIVERKPEVTYDGKGREVKKEKQIALVSDSSKVEASAEISASLFKDDLRFREEALAIFIKRTFRAEGLRHLLGLIIGLEENFRQGHFDWAINEHLERLGHRIKKHGTFDLELKKTASEIVRIFTSLFITAHQKDGKGRERIEGKRLFSIDGFKRETFNKEIIDEKITVRATDFWYKHAFDPPDGKAPMYTKLLRKIAQENHRNHPLCIYLGPLFAIFWRMTPEQKLSVKSLMDWCSLNYAPSNPNRMREIRNLEAELNYMKRQGYLGNWTNTGEDRLPSDCRNSLKCVYCLLF